MLATLISASTLRATAANLRAMASTLPGASSLLLMTTVLDLHSLELTWKWRMAPWKTIFHYKQVVFHFHVSFRECKPSNFFQLPETPILLKFQQFGQIEIYKHFACTHVYKTYRRYIYIYYTYIYHLRFVVAVFFLAAWYAMINMKIDALMLAYSGQAVVCHPGTSCVEFIVLLQYKE